MSNRRTFVCIAMLVAAGPALLLACYLTARLTPKSVFEKRANQAWVTPTGSLRLEEDIARKSPGWPRARYNLGVMYRERGRYNEALDEFEKAAQLAKTNCYGPCIVQNTGAVALSNIAAFYMDNGGDRMLATAGNVLERARQEFPPHEAVLANSIEYWIRTGELERAEAFGRAALKYAPAAAVLYSEMADVFAVQGRCAEQQEALAAIDRIDPLLNHDHVFLYRACVSSGGS